MVGFFRRPRDLVFRASLHAIRNDEGLILETNQTEHQLRFEYELGDATRIEFRLFVFEGGDGASEVEIRGYASPARQEQADVAERLMKEIGKYLLLTNKAEERQSRPKSPRHRSGERDRLPPRRYPPALPDRYYPNDLPVSGFAVAGFVLSLCSLIFFVFISLPCAILGLIFSIVARTQTNRTSGQGLAIAGMVISIVTLVVWLIILIVVGTAARRYGW